MLPPYTGLQPKGISPVKIGHKNCGHTKTPCILPTGNRKWYDQHLPSPLSHTHTFKNSFTKSSKANCLVLLKLCVTIFGLNLAGTHLEKYLSGLKVLLK